MIKQNPQTNHDAILNIFQSIDYLYGRVDKKHNKALHDLTAKVYKLKMQIDKDELDELLRFANTKE